jgi:predicted CXXCH cytochrome family protein
VETEGCTSCHRDYYGQSLGPYQLGGATSVISDPRNTKANFTAEAGTGLGGTANTVGDFSDFCLNCHTGTPPQAVKNTNTLVPYTIVFPATNFTTNSGGWNKSTYKLSSHGSAVAAITCGDCHESHGAYYPALTRFAEDTSTVNSMCLRCHNENTITQKNIRADLIKTYRHPTLYAENKHSNTETYQNMPLADRHAECADCHDPHQATATVGTPPAAGGTLTGVSGVKINWGTSAWDTWPSGVTFTPVSSVDYQYELCFKCHSYYSYGSTPPDSVSRALNGRRGGKQVDVAKEMNPNNPSYHAVVGQTKVTTYSSSGTRAYGWLNQNWSRRREWQNDDGTVASTRSSARLYCTDCHGSDNRSVFGPHGSVNPFVLIAPWDPNTGSTNDQGYRGTGGQDSGDTSSHLCFVCHDYNFYAGGYDGNNWNQDTGSSTRLSGFSRGSNYNYHSTRKHERVGCATCHGAVPHGWRKRGMLVEHRDGEPYAAYSWLELSSFDSVANWRQGSCVHGNLSSGGNPNSGYSCD